VGWLCWLCGLALLTTMGVCSGYAAWLCCL
jgi:hypothetical protein